MKDIIFNYYPANIKQSTPLGCVSLDYMLNAIRSPKKDIRYIFDQIMEAERNGDMETKHKLKTKLYSFTPCILINGSRKYSNIVKFNGILVLDFDHMENPDYASEFKNYLFNTYNFIISAWLSASKHGVRALVSIPECKTTDEFKQYFGGIKNKLGSYKGFDMAPKNCCLPLFISYDPQILIRNDYTTFKDKHIPIEKPIIKQYIVNDKTTSIEHIILKKINVIVNNGHPQLRAAAYLCGGYCGAGYIDLDYSIDMLNRMIDSNNYLSQKASVYKQTAKEMIKKGMNEPVYLTPQ